MVANSKTVAEIEALAARSEELYQAGKLAEAEAACRKLAGLLPDHAMVHYNLARILKDRGKVEAAAQSLRRTLTLAPALAEGWLNLGTLLGEAGQWAEAGEAFGKGLAARPGFWPLMSGLARVKVALGQWREAEAILRQALAQAPQAPQVLLNLANVLLDHGNLAEAVELYDRALAAAPQMAEALLGAGNAARKAGDLGRALDFYEKAVRSRPEDLAMRARLAEARFAVCDWRGIESLMPEVIEPCLKSGKGEIGPLMAVTFPVALGAEILGRFARQKAEQVAGKVTALKPAGLDRKGGRIRVGYLSADLRRHPVAYLVADLFERHDRDRFEIFAYSYGPDDGSPMRRRLEQGVDHFVDLRDFTHAEAAARIRADNISILVDLTLYTQFS
ncbi:MAG: tetratricopeptide repeat protein, partial [Magnetospirillum sp.]|nr:tetratricopeptide repeat protein [Magnetospirillum sp.]